jgi:hypothetical protein
MQDLTPTPRLERRLRAKHSFDMGYDMEWVDLPEHAARLRGEYQAALGSHPFDDRAYFEAIEPYARHLNIGAMGIVRRTMEEFGMVFEAEPRPYGDPSFAAPSEREQDERFASQRVDGGRGIPRFKLTSNDGWLVYPDEIAGALAAYDAASQDRRTEAEEDKLWREWLTWLRLTHDRGGFYVH